MTGLTTTTLAPSPHSPSHRSDSPSPLAHHLQDAQDSSRQAPLAQKNEPGLLAPTSAPAPDRQHVAHAPQEPILTFSDLSTDHLQLNPPGSLRQNGPSAINGTESTESNGYATPPAVKSIALQRRKPSPGLAARLKLLGFARVCRPTA
ncbi:hypothetical protein NPX13_g6888 [Xylaria arbuscula]|uniref:Uncharacterized protein n=1 Tax=Xylaria arbuscula TaxID=114810 RepID=A0A9W8NBP3_9PEZI|nr:hypothetical protein NPX13_g6888 [Xylaria arbuscula]